MAGPTHVARVVALALVAGAQGVGAQGAESARQPTPEATRGYVSAFDGYRAFGEAPLASWSEVNREVGRLGGHSGHVRQSAPATNLKGGAQPAPGSAPPAASGGAK